MDALTSSLAPHDLFFQIFAHPGRRAFVRQVDLRSRYTGLGSGHILDIRRAQDDLSPAYGYLMTAKIYDLASAPRRLGI